VLAGFIEADADGSDGDNWSYKMCKAPVKSSPATNQHPMFYRPDALPVTHATVSEHTFSLRFSGHFSGEPGLAGVY